MDVSPRDYEDPSGASLDEPPPGPEPKRSMAGAMRGRKDSGGAGPMGAMPQVRALAALKQVELGFREFAILMPDLAPQLGDLMSQLQPLVVSKVAQMTTGQGPAVPPGIMTPPPAQMAGPPPGAGGPGGGPPMPPPGQ